MTPFDAGQLYAAFPRLRNSPWQLTSPETPAYNCVAWAMDETDRWWWPAGQYFWPQGVPAEVSLDAFITAFVSMGFELVADTAAETGYMRIAVFANNLGPTHVARELPGGGWTSKLGQSVDITHELEALEGTTYGFVRQFMRRPH